MIVIKEEFVGSDKYQRAYKLGRADAIVLWLALKCYASQHPSSEGFVPDEDIEDLPGAPRAARKVLLALVDCGRLLPDGTRSAGLVDVVPGGWQMHDYLDHSATPEELELRRAKARLKKQKQRHEQRRELGIVQSQTRDVSRTSSIVPRGDSGGHARGHVPGDSGGHVPGDSGGHVPGDVPRDVPGTGLAGARPPAHAPAPAPVRACARPNPTQPSPLFSNKTPDPDPDAREGRVPGDSGGHEPQAEHRRYAERHGLDLDQCMRQFRAAPGSGHLTPDEAWAKITRMLEKVVTARQGRVGGVA